MASPTPSPAAPAQPSVPFAKPWRVLSGLIVPGFLLALPGGLLPLWGYHIHPNFGAAGNYFLALGAGVAGGGVLARRLGNRISLGRLLAAGCFAATIAILMLSVAAPPAQVWYQSIALLITGIAAGLVNVAVFEAVTPCYEADPATIALSAGIFLGAGSITAAGLLAQSFGENGATRLFAIVALLSTAAGVSFTLLKVERQAPREVTLARAVEDLRSPLAIMFALLLFFQFGNEWSIAGWLPVLLIDRLGLSPTTAVLLLGVYWFALIVGRIAACKALKIVHRARLLGFSAFCALFGCTALVMAANRFGVVTGVLLTGIGFSAIYPLAAEQIANRFSGYHPGYFNGIFTFALMGGMLAPFVLGHLAAVSGLRVIPTAAMAGSCAVFALIVIIRLGRKVSGH